MAATYEVNLRGGLGAHLAESLCAAAARAGAKVVGVKLVGTQIEVTFDQDVSQQSIVDILQERLRSDPVPLGLDA